MLRPLPWRMMARGCALGVIAGLMVVAFELDFPGQICEYNQATKHEDCTTYSLFPFLLIKVFDTLNYYGVAITALATVFIGVFTLTLKLSTDNLWTAAKDQIAAAENAAKMQSRDMQASIAVADKAANAAMLQAKAVIGVELPIIVAQKFAIQSVPGFSWLAGTAPEHPVIYVQFYNYGRSPAEMLGYRIVPKITNKLPDVPELVEIYYAAPGTMIYRSSFLEYTYTFEWSSDQMSKILAGETRLWIYGSVAYKDFLGNRHDVGFCAMALPGPNNRLAFVYSSDTPAAYTYRKSE